MGHIFYPHHRRQLHLGRKCVCLMGYGGVLVAATALRLPCVFRYFWHIYCPGCGMTRAWLAVLSLDLRTALTYNGMFWSVPILLLYILLDGRVFRRRVIDTLILSIIGAGFIGLFVARMCGVGIQPL